MATSPPPSPYAPLPLGVTLPLPLPNALPSPSPPPPPPLLPGDSSLAPATPACTLLAPRRYGAERSRHQPWRGLAEPQQSSLHHSMMTYAMQLQEERTQAQQRSSEEPRVLSRYCVEHHAASSTASVISGERRGTHPMTRTPSMKAATQLQQTRRKGERRHRRDTSDVSDSAQKQWVHCGASSAA